MSLSKTIIEQYGSLLEKHPDCIILCQVGEFYEIFGESAQKIHKILGIALTKKGKLPMCGFPKGSLNRYVSILLKHNHKIVICDQGNKKTNKELLQRHVTRIITPGTIFEDELNNNATNYLLFIKKTHKNCYCLSWADLSTGEFLYTTTHKAIEMINIILPSEIIIDESSLFLMKQIQGYQNPCISRAEPVTNGNEILYSYYKKYFYEMIEEEENACGTIIQYAKNNNINPVLRTPKRNNNSEKMFITNNALLSLEIFKKQYGEENNTFFSHLNKTSTTAGSRMLRKWLASPYTNIDEIEKRLNAVALLCKNYEETLEIQSLLKQCSDLEKILVKIKSEKATTIDLLLLQKTIQSSHKISKILLKIGLLQKNEKKNLLYLIFSNLCDPNNIMTEIQKTIENTKEKDNTVDIKKDNFPELKKMHQELLKQKEKIKKLENKYKNISGIRKLSIKYHTKHGYIIEIPNNETNILCDKESFIYSHSTMEKAIFHTEELYITERHINTITIEIKNTEKEILLSLCKFITNHAETMYNLTNATAKLDVLISFAIQATKYNYTKPILKYENILNIKNGRHPILENKVKNFIPNDLHLHNNSWILTAPNMSGKSTFLRQNALIIIMAQIGSFVPADFAEIGIVDRLFTRIGSGDALIKGMSTFMIEMSETAEIINNTTNNSFVIMDEIGRGTCFQDGFAIALATIEYLCKKKQCRTIFATHFYQLPQKASHIVNLDSYTIDTTINDDGEIIFLYKINKGQAKESMALKIAQIAGIPLPILLKAQQIKKEMEQEK